jgi:hypothetical protein
MGQTASRSTPELPRGRRHPRPSDGRRAGGEGCGRGVEIVPIGVFGDLPKAPRCKDAKPVRSSNLIRSRPLKSRLVVALCERRRVFFCGNPAVTDRRYSRKPVFRPAVSAGKGSATVPVAPVGVSPTESGSAFIRAIGGQNSGFGIPLRSLPPSALLLRRTGRSLLWTLSPQSAIRNRRVPQTGRVSVHANTNFPPFRIPHLNASATHYGCVTYQSPPSEKFGRDSVSSTPERPRAAPVIPEPPRQAKA